MTKTCVEFPEDICVFFQLFYLLKKIIN